MFSGINTLLKKRFFKLGVEIVIILVIYLAIKSYMQRELADGPMPAFEGTLLGVHGSESQIFNFQSYPGNSLSKGKPKLLHFWAIWCSICKMEEDSVISISEDYEVITVAMNSGNDMEISAYLEEQGLSYPVVVDEHGTIAERFGVRGVPASFIIDPDGNIDFTEVGFTTELGLRLRLWLAGW